jgi:hypothetical protein
MGGSLSEFLAVAGGRPVDLPLDASMMSGIAIVQRVLQPVAGANPGGRNVFVPQ